MQTKHYDAEALHEAGRFADAVGKVAQLIGRSLAGLNALADLRPPSEEERRAAEERRQRYEAEQRAYESERLRRNPGRLRYRSRRPLWYRLKYRVRGHQRPASLIHELPDWYDY